MHYIFEKLEELKNKFTGYLGHKKKLAALDNYSEVVPFHHKGYLILIKNCMQEGFLGQQESDFLAYMVEKYFKDTNYLDWSHKTHWLKSEMARLDKHYRSKSAMQPTLFEMDKIGKTPTIPFEVLAEQHKKLQYARRR